MMNSSSESVKANRAPARMAGASRGSTTYLSRLNVFAPRSLAAALEAGVEPLQACRHEQEDERRRVHALADHRGRRRERLVKHAREQHEQAHAIRRPGIMIGRTIAIRIPLRKGSRERTSGNAAAVPTIVLTAVTSRAMRIVVVSASRIW